MADRTLTINHADGGSETYTVNRDKFAGVRDMSIDGSTVSVDHTAVPKEQNKETTFGGSQSITVNRDIEPLLSKVVGGAAAAYSLRDLNDSQGNNNVVRVRRESDNSEKDFIAKEVSNGTMARWVNEQPTLPLDLRELDANTGERDGALIEAAAAYSLRKLKEDFTGDVVEVRRNVDGETEGFTAAEVTDGTLEGFVKGEEVIYESDFSAGEDGWIRAYPRVTIEGNIDGIGGRDNCLKIMALEESSPWFGKQGILRKGARYKVSYEFYTEGNFGINLVSNGYASSGVSNGNWVSYEADFISDNNFLQFIRPYNDYPAYIRNVKVISYAENELPLDQATGAAAAYSLRSLGTNQWEYAGDTLEYESDFSAGTDGWFTEQATSTGNIDNIGGRNDCLEIVATATNYTYGGIGGVLTIGATYRVTAEVYISSGANFDTISLNNGGTQVDPIPNPAEDEWISLSATFNATSTQIKVGGGPQSLGATYYIRNVKVYESLGDTEYLPSGKYVVQTRRSSDDAVKSFTASEVADGTLTDWVTASLSNGVFQNNGYETYSGASESGFSVTNTTTAGFATSTIPSGVTGNKLKVSFDIVVVSGSPKIALRATTGAGTASNSLEMTTSGSHTVTLTATGSYSYVGFSEGDAPSDFTVSNFQIIGQDGHVKTWYDQSGSDNHAVQTDTAKQPKIVEDGTYLGEVDFLNGTNTFLETTNSDLCNVSELSVFTVLEPHIAASQCVAFSCGSTVAGSSGYGGWKLNLNGYTDTAEFQTQAVSNSALTSLDASVTADDTLLSYVATFPNASTFANGQAGTTATSAVSPNNTNETIRRFRIGCQYTFQTAGFYTKPIKEIIIYNSDQSDKRRAIEENIANHYDISLAAFSRDGTVSTWYDQSGSTPANHATQTDPTKQPKIVVNGTYLGEIKFESGLYVEKTGLSLSGPFSTFSLSNANSQHSGALLKFGTGFSQQYRSDRSLLLQYGDTNYSNTNVYTVGEQNVMSFIFDSTSLGYYNGTEVINDAATGATATQFRVGNSSFGLDGDVKEIIIYNSNQSDNRTAIEANIGETYGITDIPAANDTVNGFVQTWYDQSGSGNDAEQISATKQPKIVVNGTYLGEIKFENGLYVQKTGLSLSGPFSTFILSNANSQHNGALLNFGNFSQQYRSDRSILLQYGDTNFSSAGVYTVGEQNVMSFIFDTTGLGYYNGTEVINDATTGATATQFRVGNSSTGLDGDVKEVIIYNSNQSANRPAIETNIANQYGITLS